MSTSCPASKRMIANILRLSYKDGDGTLDFEESSAIFTKLNVLSHMCLLSRPPDQSRL